MKKLIVQEAYKKVNNIHPMAIKFGVTRKQIRYWKAHNSQIEDVTSLNKKYKDIQHCVWL